MPGFGDNTEEQKEAKQAMEAKRGRVDRDPAAFARRARQYHNVGQHSLQVAKKISEEVAKLDDYSIYTTCATLPLYMTHLSTESIPDTVAGQLGLRYKGLLHYIDWIIAYAADEKETSLESYDEDDIKAMLIKANDGCNQIEGNAWAAIKGEIDDKVASAKEKLTFDIQSIVDDHALRYFNVLKRNDYPKATLASDLAEAIEGTTGSAYANDVITLTNAIDTEYERAKGELDNSIAGISDRIGAVFARNGFFFGLKTSADEYPIDFSKDFFNEVNPSDRLLLQATENPFTFATQKILNFVDCPREDIGGNAVGGLTNALGAITLPESAINYSEDEFVEQVREHVDVTLAPLLGALYGRIPDFPTFHKVIKQVSPEIRPTIYQVWSKRQSANLQNVVNDAKYEAANGRDKAKLDAFVKKLDKRRELSFETKHLLLIQYIEKYEMEEMVCEIQGHNDLGKGLKEGITAYCEGVLTSDGIKDTALNVTKASPALAMLAGAINKIKSGAEKASAGQPFFEKDNTVDWSEVLGNVIGFGGDILDVFAGIGIGVAIAGIRKLIPDFSGAWSLWRKSVKMRNKTRAELQDVMAQDGNITPSRVVDLETRIVALTIAVNKQLKKVMGCLTEILKRLIGIVSAILKFLGLTYIVGLSLSLLKSTLHLCQNLYYIGRAVYKRMKGTKGVARRGAAARFVNDAINGEEYAVELINTSKVLRGDDFNDYKDDVYEDLPTTPSDVKGFIQHVVAKSADIHIAFEELLTEKLFKKLSSKPTPQLINTLFPTIGAASNITSMAM